MSDVTIKELLGAGVHFGHQTRRWNPKMAPYIYGEKNGIHIFDLPRTLEEIVRACDFVRELAAGGGTVLFVGTKRQVQSAIEEAAVAARMPYVNFRWLGGMLTNFKTINRRIFYMKELTEMENNGDMEQLPKKERLRLRRELVQLEKALGGVAEMTSLPSAMFVVDINAEQIAVKEAVRLNIPVIALTDSNCDPDPVEYVIPGNDDAIRAASLVANAVAAACAEGRNRAESEAAAAAEGAAEAPGPQPVRAVPQAPAPHAPEEETEDAGRTKVDEPVADLPADRTEQSGEDGEDGGAAAGTDAAAEVYRVPAPPEEGASGETEQPPESVPVPGGERAADDNENPAPAAGESGRETVDETQS